MTNDSDSGAVSQLVLVHYFPLTVHVITLTLNEKKQLSLQCLSFVLLD